MICALGTLETRISSYEAKSTAAQYMLHTFSSLVCRSLAYSWFKTSPRSSVLSRIWAFTRQVYRFSSPQQWKCSQAGNNSTNTPSTLPRPASYCMNRLEGTKSALENGGASIPILLPSSRWMNADAALNISTSAEI